METVADPIHEARARFPQDRCVTRIKVPDKLREVRTKRSCNPPNSCESREHEEMNNCPRNIYFLKETTNNDNRYFLLHRQFNKQCELYNLGQLPP